MCTVLQTFQSVCTGILSFHTHNHLSGGQGIYNNCHFIVGKKHNSKNVMSAALCLTSKTHNNQNLSSPQILVMITMWSQSITYVVVSQSSLRCINQFFLVETKHRISKMSSLKGDNLDRDIASHTTSTERSRISSFPMMSPSPRKGTLFPSITPSLLTGRKILQTEEKGERHGREREGSLGQKK